MPSRKKQLKEQIARTQDPIIRMQLDALLSKKGQPPSKVSRRIEDAFDSLWGPAMRRWPAGVPLVLFVVILTIIAFIIFVILECMTMV